MMLLGEADHRNMMKKDVLERAQMLARCTAPEFLEKHNTKKNNILHLAASRGNVDFLKVVLPIIVEKFRKQAFIKPLELIII